jgi:DNA-binding transcriptional regulator YdaS (Cro superfamily)
MNLKTWYKQSTANDKKRLAQLSGTTYAYVKQICLGFKKPSWLLAVRIEKATMKMDPFKTVPREVIRPDLAKLMK